MNIKALHTADKPVEARHLFNNEQGQITSTHIQAGQELKAHKTPVPALLICISGEAVFTTEQQETHTLRTGDHVHIAPGVLHWLNAHEDSYLLLCK